MDQPMKILVVDDSRMIRQTIRKELEAGGYAVSEAKNGFEALARVAVSSPPDLVTLDIEMPKLNGLNTCRKLREDRYTRFFSHCPHNQMPVIFVTGNDTMEDRKTGFQLEAADFISKPFAEGAILSAVNKVLKPAEIVRGLTALVVDDSEIARRIVSKFLKREGITVILAEDGLQALDILRQRCEEIDMVVTDMIMPVMDGCELTRKIRGELNLSDLPVLFLTGGEEQSELLKVFKAGATDHLVKPFAKEELLARIMVHVKRNLMNKQLRNMVNELTDLNHMKDNLLAVCSHDLRSPLNGILGFADMLLEKEYLEAEDKEGLSHIKASGNILLGLINDILDLSKAKAETVELKMEPIEIFNVVKTSIRSLKQMADDKGQEIQLSNQCEGAVILGNAGGLGRVFNNLLSNAIKFTPEKGTIRIEIEPESEDHISVKVMDTGIGIPKDKIPCLFDQFTKTSQIGTSGEQGTGLGMSIVKEILENHGVTIDVESDVQEGSCFNLHFALSKESPVTSPAPPDFMTASKSTADKKKKHLNILLAEDNPVNQKLAEKMLAKAGHTVVTAHNGQEAYKRYTASPDDFDLIFMDIQMPVMDGMAATREIRKFETIDRLQQSTNQKVPIVAMTGQAMDGDRENCIETGMDDYMVKPISKAVVLEMVQKWGTRRP